MGTVSDKLTYLNGTKTALKDSINLMGANITDDTFRSYADKIKDGLLDIMNNGTEEIWNNWEKVSATDVAEATLNNTVQAPMEIDVKGDTEQTQYQGYNILPLASANNNGIDFVVEGDSIIANGTATNIARDFLLGSGTATESNMYLLEAGTWYISAEKADIPIFIAKVGGISLVTLTSSNLSKSFTIEEDTYVAVFARIAKDVVATNLTSSKIMLSKVNADYEPFCGGQASPNPEFPQPIENVEGRSCRNLLQPNELTEQTINGITFTPIYKEGKLQYINLNGTATSDANYAIRAASNRQTFQTGSYTLNGCPTNSSNVVLYGSANNLSSNFVDSGNGATFSLSSSGNVWVNIKVNNSNTVNNIKVYPMIRKSTESNSAYEPYFEGKRLEFNVCNKNLAKALRLGYYAGATGIYNSNRNYCCSSEPIQIKSGSTYKFSIDGVGVEGYAYEYDKNGTYLGKIYFMANSVYTPTSGASYFNYAFKDSTVANVPLDSKVQIEEGTTATSYEEHKQQMIPFPLQDGQKLMEGDYLADDGIHHTKTQTTLTATVTILRDITLGGITGKYAVYSLPGAKGQGNVATNKFKSDRISYNNGKIIKYAGYVIAKSLVVLTNSEDTLENFNSKIKGSIVEYELEEETIDPYTPAQQEAYNNLKQAKSYNEVTHITQVTDSLPAILNVVALENI